MDSTASQTKYLRTRGETVGFTGEIDSPYGNCQQETGIWVGPKDGVIVQSLGLKAPRSKHDGDEGMNKGNEMHVPEVGQVTGGRLHGDGGTNFCASSCWPCHMRQGRGPWR